MRIISPVDNLDETVALLEAGADELYGGFVPAAWQKSYQLLASVNQRTFSGAQIESLEELTAIIASVHRFGRKFSLTLNAPYFIDRQLPLVIDLVGQAVEAGVDGLILADLGLLKVLRRQFPDVEYHASTLAHLSNSRAVGLYRDLGFQRVVLQRHLSIADMEQIVSHLPGLPLDAFLLVGKCPNTEGLCSFHHSSPDKIWPCETPYDIDALNGEATPELTAAIRRQASWSTTNRRHGCGLCAIPHLQRIGISGLKLVGRGAPAAQKLANIQLVREFLRLANESVADVDYRAAARRAFERRFGVRCSPNVCYYPEFYEGE